MSKSQRPTVADVLGGYVAEQCDILLGIGGELERAFAEDRAGQLPAEPIHDARVACRRLRSLVRVFGEFLRSPQAARLSDDLRWFGLRLGGLRDLDVLSARLAEDLERLDDDLVLHDAGHELADQLLFRRRIALAALRDALHDERYPELITELQQWQQQPAWSPDAGKPAGKLKKRVNRAGRRLDRRLHHAADAIRADDPETDDLIHAARKQLKRHRYALEAAGPVLGADADRITARHKRLQDQLGEYQDSRLASVLLRDLGGIPGRNGFTFGVLLAQETERRRKLRKKIAKHS